MVISKTNNLNKGLQNKNKKILKSTGYTYILFLKCKAFHGYLLKTLHFLR